MDRWHELMARMQQEERLQDAEGYRQAQLLLANAGKDKTWRGRARARLSDVLDALAQRILDDIASYPSRVARPARRLRSSSTAPREFSR